MEMVDEWMKITTWGRKVENGEGGFSSFALDIAQQSGGSTAVKDLDYN